MATGPICQTCGVEATSKYVDFKEHLGAVLFYIHREYRGYMCKRCIHKRFWKTTPVTAVLGWWGIKSLFITPYVLCNNVARYLLALTLEPPAHDAAHPKFDPIWAGSLKPHHADLQRRMAAGEDVMPIAQELGQRLDIPPAQVICYVAEHIGSFTAGDVIVIRRKDRSAATEHSST